MKGWQKDALCLLVIMLVLLGVFWPVVTGRATFVPTDILHQLKLPFGAGVTQIHVKNHFNVDSVIDSCTSAIFFQRCVRSGQWPIWNPYLWCGHPYHALSTLSFACPFQLACWTFLPMPAGYDWAIILQFLAAGGFMYWLLRHWRLQPLACLLGALAYCLNSQFPFLYWHATLRAFVWMPLVILFFDRAVRGAGWRDGIVAGVLAGVAVVSGSIQTAVYVLLLLGIYAGATALVRRGDVPLMRVAGVTAWVGTMAVLLAAFQLLPTLELMRLDASGRTVGALASWRDRLGAVPFLSTFVVPGLWGSTESFDLFKAIRATAGEFQGYIGVASFALLLLALARGREPQVKVLALCAGTVIGLLVFVPWIRSRLYYRFFIGYIFAAAGLAAWGLDWLLNRPPGAPAAPRERRALWALAVFLVLAAAGVLAVQWIYAAWSQPLTEFSNRVVARRAVGTFSGFAASGTDWLKTRVDDFWRHYRLANPAFWIPFVAGGVAIAVALARLRGKLRRGSGLIFVGLVVVDLAVVTWRLTPMIDLKTYPLYPATPQTDYLRHAAGRVAHWPNSGRGILDDELLMPYGVPAFDSCGSMWPLTTWKLFKDTGRLTNAAALGIGAVTHVLSPTNNFPTDPALELVDDRDGVRIYRNTLALPRARFVSQYRNVASVADCKAIMARPDWQPLAMPLIETDRPAAATNAAAQVRIVAETTTEVELTVQADTAGYVVLADTFYPGWECSVDGRPTPVLRANGAQRAALVEPGHHRVRFQYAPASIRLGAIISGATLLLCVGGWFKRGRS